MEEVIELSAGCLWVILQSARNTSVLWMDQWEDYEDREGKLVFIGIDLRWEVFEKIFNQYLVVHNEKQQK
ncbi:MAG: GTP-binding protein [Cyclobacteriaceae bacterium]|nr:GTP-binding protein [Cyclobacteriaceae bacterium]